MLKGNPLYLVTEPVGGHEPLRYAAAGPHTLVACVDVERITNTPHGRLARATRARCCYTTPGHSRLVMADLEKVVGWCLSRLAEEPVRAVVYALEEIRKRQGPAEPVSALPPFPRPTKADLVAAIKHIRQEVAPRSEVNRGLSSVQAQSPQPVENITEWRTPAGQLLRQLATAEGEPLFVARDVCNALGLVRVDSALRALADDEKGTQTLSTLGGPQQFLVITEPGLYALMARSTKPEARSFCRWVHHEVLPSIRKTGAYIAPEPKAGLVRAPSSADVMRLIGIVEGLATQVETLSRQQLPATAYESLVESAVADRFDTLEARLAKLEAPKGDLFPRPLVLPPITLCRPKRDDFVGWFTRQCAMRGVRNRPNDNAVAKMLSRTYAQLKAEYNCDVYALRGNKGKALHLVAVEAGFEDELFECAETVFKGLDKAAAAE